MQTADAQERNRRTPALVTSQPAGTVNKAPHRDIRHDSTPQPGRRARPASPRQDLGPTGALVGVLAAAVAIGVAQFASGLGVPQSSRSSRSARPPSASPSSVREFAISTFGPDDKTALLAGILVILAVFAAIIGILAVRRLAYGLFGLAVFAAIGLAAALSRPTASSGDAVPTLVGAAAGALALTFLTWGAKGIIEPSAPAMIVPPSYTADPGTLAPPDLPRRRAESTPVRPKPDPPPTLRSGPAYKFVYLPDPADSPPSRWPARRRFLVTGGAAAAVAALGIAAGDNLTNEHNVAAARSAIRFPRPARPAAPLPAGAT